MPRPLPAEPKVRVNITLPPKLHQEITARADDSLRSFSAELTLLLHQGLRRVMEKDCEMAEAILAAHGIEK